MKGFGIKVVVLSVMCKRSVLINFNCQVNTTHINLKRGGQLNNSPDQIDLWAYLQGLSWLLNDVGRAGPPWTSSPLVVSGCIRKLVKSEPVSEQVAFLHHFCFKFLLLFLP